MENAGSMGEMKIAWTILIVKLEGKKPLWRPRHRENTE
jgi:hypothetical protein